MIGATSMLRLTLKVTVLVGCCRLLIEDVKIELCGGSGRVHGSIAQAELLKLQKSGQFPDEPVRITV